MDYKNKQIIEIILSNPYSEWDVLINTLKISEKKLTKADNQTHTYFMQDEKSLTKKVLGV